MRPGVRDHSRHDTDPGCDVGLLAVPSPWHEGVAGDGERPFVGTEGTWTLGRIGGVRFQGGSFGTCTGTAEGVIGRKCTEIVWSWGVAVPFRALNDGGAVRAVELSAEGPVVFWRREAQAAMAFGVSESFSVTEDGQIVDDQTGSVWTLDGRAVEGRRAGEQLPPVETAYVALWRAWSDFHPNTDVWSDGS